MYYIERVVKTDKPVMVSFRPTDQDFELLEWLKQRLGVAYPQIIRLGLRRLYRDEHDKK